MEKTARSGLSGGRHFHIEPVFPRPRQPWEAGKQQNLEIQPKNVCPIGSYELWEAPIPPRLPDNGEKISEGISTPPIFPAPREALPSPFQGLFALV